LVTVGHIPAMAFGTLAGGIGDLRLLEESLEQAGRAILNEAERIFENTGVRVTRVFSHGEPSLEIMEKAGEHKAD